MSATSELHQCAECGAVGVRLDEADTCEECVDVREGLAGALEEDLEHAVRDLREYGLSDDDIRAAIAMCLDDRLGPLQNTRLQRVRDEYGRPAWRGPSSLWMEHEGRPHTNLHDMRRLLFGLSLEAYAKRLDVSPQDLALWEHGVLPPRDIALRMVERGGLALDHIVNAAPHDGCYCNRCGEDAPGNPYRFEQGWDVAADGAGSVELVCPDCLKPGDLIWPSDEAA